MLKRVVLLALVAIVLLSSAAMADTLVTYATQGTFSNLGGSGWTGSGTNSITNGSLTLTFNAVGTFPTDTTTGAGGVGAGPIDLVNHFDGESDWASALLGNFVISGSGSNTLPVGANFQIDVYQFMPPSPNVSTATATFKGTISYLSGGPSIIFGAPTFTWSNGITYTQTQPTLAGIYWGVESHTYLNAGSTGPTSLNGIAYVPEPSSIMFFGTGLAGIAGVLRRRLGK